MSQKHITHTYTYIQGPPGGGSHTPPGPSVGGLLPLPRLPRGPVGGGAYRGALGGGGEGGQSPKRFPF